MDDQLTLIQYSERPESRTLEGIEKVSVRLRCVECREDLTADNYHRPESPGLGTRGNANCLEKIRWTVPAKVAHCSHRSRKHDRFFRGQRSCDKICGFLERIGAVRYNDTRYIGSREMLANSCAERPHQLDCHVGTRIGSPFLRLHTCHCVDPARRTHDLTRSQRRRGACSAGIVTHCNRTTGEENDDHEVAPRRGTAASRCIASSANASREAQSSAAASIAYVISESATSRSSAADLSSQSPVKSASASSMKKRDIAWTSSNFRPSAIRQRRSDSSCGGCGALEASHSQASITGTSGPVRCRRQRQGRRAISRRLELQPAPCGACHPPGLRPSWPHRG